MKMSPEDILSWQGKVERLPYLFWGVLLFGLKSHLDRFVPHTLGYEGGYDSYWQGLWMYISFGPLPNLGQWQNTGYFLTLLWIALPFIYAGLCLTYKRLRSLGLSPALVALFFVPYLNLAFFVILSFLSSKPAPGKPGPTVVPWYAKHIPRGKLASASLGWLATITCGAAVSLLVIYVFRSYGWTLFVGIPFFGGLIATLFYGFHQPRSFKECMAVAALSSVAMGVFFLVTALEGLICLIMASPLMGALGILGGVVGYLIQTGRGRHHDVASTSFSMLLFLPMSAFFETAEPPRARVVTAVEIAAPAEVVWDRLVAFSPIPEERSWLFHTGIAYPTHATIEGKGVGAIRYCHFSTGVFVEPIEVWEAPRRLAFGVRQQPDPMREMALYGQIHPPHLAGYFRTERGQFLIEPLGEGQVRLTGTTWYRQNLWPNAYWRLWTEWLIHHIHLRVLDHIRQVSESAPVPNPTL